MDKQAELALQMFAMPTMCLKCSECGVIWSTNRSTVLEGTTVAIERGWTVNGILAKALCPECSKYSSIYRSV